MATFNNNPFIFTTERELMPIWSNSSCLFNPSDLEYDFDWNLDQQEDTNMNFEEFVELPPTPPVASISEPPEVALVNVKNEFCNTPQETWDKPQIPPAYIFNAMVQYTYPQDTTYEVVHNPPIICYNNLPSTNVYPIMSRQFVHALQPPPYEVNYIKPQVFPIQHQLIQENPPEELEDEDHVVDNEVAYNLPLKRSRDDDPDLSLLGCVGDDPTMDFKLPASKSPIMEAMVVCALKNWGITIAKNTPTQVVFRVTDFDRYYRISRAICSKQHPTEDIGSRVKSLRRWFDNFPKKKDRIDNPNFLLSVKSSGTKKVNEMIERNTRLLGVQKRRRRQ